MEKRPKKEAVVRRVIYRKRETIKCNVMAVGIRGMRLSVEVEEGGYYTRPTIGETPPCPKRQSLGGVWPKLHEEPPPKTDARYGV